MSPTQFHDHHAKKDEPNGGLCPSPLKINKDSHFIKKPSPSSSSSSTSSLANGAAAVTPKPQPRHPVIIYTHSPKIIHTHPRDFMALVQKLTGLSRSDDDVRLRPNPHAGAGSSEDENKNTNKAVVGGGDDESSSVVTDENCSSTVGDLQVNSCMVPPFFEPPPNPYLSNIPLFTANSADFLCSSQPFYNYTDSLLFNPTVRSSISSSTLEGVNEFREY